MLDDVLQHPQPELGEHRAAGHRRRSRCQRRHVALGHLRLRAELRRLPARRGARRGPGGPTQGPRGRLYDLRDVHGHGRSGHESGHVDRRARPAGDRRRDHDPGGAGDPRSHVHARSRAQPRTGRLRRRRSSWLRLWPADRGRGHRRIGVALGVRSDRAACRRVARLDVRPRAAGSRRGDRSCRAARGAHRDDRTGEHRVRAHARGGGGLGQPRDAGGAGRRDRAADGVRSSSSAACPSRSCRPTSGRCRTSPR